MSIPFLYLKLTVGNKPINGESTEKHFEKQIALESVAWDMSSKHEPVDDKKDTKKVKTTNTPKRVTLTKAFDRSTINLCDFMAKRTAFDEATITVVKSLAWDENPRPLIEMKLTQGYVESVSLTATESGKSVGVKETVTLSFSSLKMLYYSNVVSSLRSDAPATTFQIDMPSEVE